MQTEQVVYVNGEYLPESQAKVSVFDRGFLFGDAVYEVSTVLSGQLVDNDAHLARLKRSLEAMDMDAPCALTDIPDIQRRLIQDNALEEGIVYLQISRGAAPRDFAFPDTATPSLVMFCQHKPVLSHPKAETGLKVALLPDLRWVRRDIKTVNLLGPVLTKEAAKAKGADDAWMVEEGLITEGTSNNAFILTREGTLVTRQLGTEILHGITRKAVLAVARGAGLKIEERAFSVSEALSAAEAFVTSASTFVMPVVDIDGTQIGDGRPGPVARDLRARYIAFAKETLS